MNSSPPDTLGELDMRNILIEDLGLDPDEELPNWLEVLVEELIDTGWRKEQ